MSETEQEKRQRVDEERRHKELMEQNMKIEEQRRQDEERRHEERLALERESYTGKKKKKEKKKPSKKTQIVGFIIAIIFMISFLINNISNEVKDRSEEKGGVKYVRVMESKKTSLVFSWKPPRKIEIMEVASAKEIKDPMYKSSTLQIEYKEATETEPIPDVNTFLIGNYEYKNDTFTATNIEQEQIFTIEDLKPNTRYFYSFGVVHFLEENEAIFIDGKRVHEATTLP